MLAIFIGYEDNWIGWGVVNLFGKYAFSQDVIFNEKQPGRLANKRSQKSSKAETTPVDSPRPSPKGPHAPMTTPGPPDSGPHCNPQRGAHPVPAENLKSMSAVSLLREAMVDLGPMKSFLIDYAAIAVTETFLAACPANTLDVFKSKCIHDVICNATRPDTYIPNTRGPWDLTKAPLTIQEAMARPDWPKWKVACEKELDNM
ncbi:hypothetical protein C8J56DRAFT_1065945 [Mycena floridula]|nr:hypothetical protein C8J56DRAFT_1065945 [Mycena floridula]